MKIAINGFGRIGRMFFRAAFDQEGLDITHINDVAGAETFAHLLKYDSTYGEWDHEVSARDGCLVVSGREIRVLNEKDPGKLPWKESKIDIVLESTGIFRKRKQAQQHMDAGAKKVLISAPGKSPLDGNFVPGVNDDAYDADRHDIISIGSCTTNCLAPIAKVLHEEYGIRRGLINTVHAYTSNQRLIDGPHKDLRRARSAADNLIPTTTGAAEAIGLILPELAGKLSGLSIRVPVKCGSILDLTCELEKRTDPEEINGTVREWANGRMKGILQGCDAPIVSSDIIGNPHSCIFSTLDTFVQEATLVKVLAWYDNEWGFSNRLVDMMRRMV